MKNPDFLLCAFPKVGSTWIKFILMHYFKYLFKLQENVGFDTMFTFIPNVKDAAPSVRGLHNYAFEHVQGMPFIAADEDAWDFITLPGNVLFMTRRVHDILVSLYFHSTRQWKWYDQDIKTFIRDPSKGLMRWVHYMNVWAPATEGIAVRLFAGTPQERIIPKSERRFFVFTYESLTADPLEVCSRIVDFLKIPYEENKLLAAIRQSSFQKMLAAEMKTGIPEHNYDRNDKDARRVRDGKMKGYVNYLDREDIDWINETCEKELCESAKKLVVECGLAVGKDHPK